MGTALTETQMELLWRLHPEPTLCFDGDRAGMQAASRAIDRALPLLQPGKSFKFAIVTGGKDPDDMLREQGAGALKAQLAAATPFIDALFIRERDAGPLETPEHRAGLKQRLRAAAKAIVDADLAAAYREALAVRLDALFARPRQLASPTPKSAGGRWKRFDPPPGSALPRSRDAARRLAGAVNPVAAALALQAIADPGIVDDHLEALESRGFGDPALDDLAKEIIRLRLDAERLDSDALQRHLAEAGFSMLLIDVDQAAANAGAPFPKDDVTLTAARSQWSYAFGVLNRVAALEDALSLAKQSLVGADSAATLMALKKERDLLRQAIRTGSIWTGGAES